MNGDKIISPGFNAVLPVELLLNWYRLNKRDLPWRQTTDIYHIWISEVMLQQTQVSTVIPYYHRFINEFPTIFDLADAAPEKVLKAWEGLGYYSRVRNFQHAAKQVVNEYNGVMPSSLEELQNLAGIGPYISAALLSIGLKKPFPVVDGNVFRVFTRFFNFREDIRKGGTKRAIFNHLSTIIPEDEPGDFNQAIMELGALLCTPSSPKCGDCPLGESCIASILNCQDEVPVKSATLSPPTHRVSLAILIHNNTFFIQQRPAEGHLGGMWEFPGGKSGKNESEMETVIRECREELAHTFDGFQELTRIKHQYTHFGIDVTVFTCILKKKTEIDTKLPFRWIRFEEIGTYPFPKANHKIFPALKNFLDQIE